MTDKQIAEARAALAACPTCAVGERPTDGAWGFAGPKTKREAQALSAVHNALPLALNALEEARRLLKNAVGAFVKCDACKGTGQKPKYIMCPECEGEGYFSMDEINAHLRGNGG